VFDLEITSYNTDMEKQGKRRKFAPEFKLRVVLESLQRDTTIEAVGRKYGVGSPLINRWRAEFKELAPTIFLDKRDPKQKGKALGFAPGQSPDELKMIIGDLTVENAILKKVEGLLS
jgi:transposase